eukprot:jgi/Psemu1/287400/fgenesh1_pg.189_\
MWMGHEEIHKLSAVSIKILTRPSVSARPSFVEFSTSTECDVVYDVNASAACVRTNSIVHGLVSFEDDEEEDVGMSGATDSLRAIPKPTAASKNRVYYATSVHLAAGDEKATSGQHCNTDSSLLPFGGNSSIRMIHLPPNRSDLMETLFAAPAAAANETRKGTDYLHNASFPDEPNDGGDTDCRGVVEDDVDLVLFDRFFMEEAHSFRFRERFPSAAMVLDMQDMHSLRWGRQKIVEEWDKRMLRQRQQEKKKPTTEKTAKESSAKEKAIWDPLGCLPEVMNYLPSVGEDDRLTRELASIHRSDLVLVCSPVEAQLLKTIYRVPYDKLCMASFFVDPEVVDQYHHSTTVTSSAPRFVFCGGFKHAPNADAVRLLIDFVWPKLRAKLPEATLHIYGAFCPDHLLQINSHPKHRNHSRTRGITIHGFEPDLTKIFGSREIDGRSILLAPLRFGAGIKGKIIDAWTFGMPVVTTPVGSEGMTMCTTEVQNDTKDESRHVEDYLTFGGLIASTLEDFCSSAVKLAENPVEYRKALRNARYILQNQFSSSKNWGDVRKSLLQVLSKEALAKKRNGDYTQAMLWHQSMRSTEYFSRWVELKESLRRKKT